MSPPPLSHPLPPFTDFSGETDFDTTRFSPNFLSPLLKITLLVNLLLLVGSDFLDWKVRDSYAADTSRFLCSPDCFYFSLSLSLVLFQYFFLEWKRNFVEERYVARNEKGSMDKISYPRLSRVPLSIQCWLKNHLFVLKRGGVERQIILDSARIVAR